MRARPVASARASALARVLVVLTIAASSLLATGAAPERARAAETATAVDPAFRAAMKRFLIAQNIPAQMGDQMAYSAAEQALATLAAGGVQTSEATQTIVLEEARADFGKRFGDVEYLTDLYAGVYAKHFSLDEIDRIATFWESEVGRKLMASLPAINEAFFLKLQQASTPLNATFQTRLEKRLRDEGVIGAAP